MEIRIEVEKLKGLGLTPTEKIILAFKNGGAVNRLINQRTMAGLLEMTDATVSRGIKKLKRLKLI